MTLEEICKLAEKYSIARVVLNDDGSPREVEFAGTMQLVGGDAPTAKPGEEEEPLNDYEMALHRTAAAALGKRGRA